MEHQEKKFDRIHTDEEVHTLLSTSFDQPVLNFSPIGGGTINFVYGAELEDGRAIVIRVSPDGKGGSSNRFAQEAWIYRQCANIGIAVPEVLKIDPSATTFMEPYMITTRLPGEPGSNFLRRNELPQILERAGSVLSDIHAVQIDGFGKLEEVDGKYKGRYDSMIDYICSSIEKSDWRPHLTQNGLLKDSEVEQMLHWFSTNKDLFNPPQAVLVHGDYNLSNTLIKDGNIAGVLDFENAMAGDPVQDFSIHYLFARPYGGSIDPLVKGYKNKKIFDNSFDKKLHAYAWLSALPSMSHAYKRGDQERGQRRKMVADEAVEYLIREN